jgi:hypothetical protein
VPENVVEVRMNPDTGLSEWDKSKVAVPALFKIGTEPK